MRTDLKSLFCIGFQLFLLSMGRTGALSGLIQRPASVQGAEDSAGPFRLEYRMPVDEHRKIMSRMQEFAWSHWKSQLAGRLEYVFVTAEGGRVEQTMFFEKDEHEVYRVRIERTELGGRPSHHFILRTTKLAYSVQRLDQKRPIEDNYAPFRDSEELRPGTYILDFRDRDDQVILRWEPDRTL